MNIYLYNIIFFVLIALLEALLWHYSVNKISIVTAKRLHIPLVLIRCAWFAYLFIITDKDFASVSSLIMCYPFWHLGCMYQFRNWLNRKVYKRGFIDVASSSSTSFVDKIFNFDFITRGMMLIVGTVFYFLWNSM